MKAVCIEPIDHRFPGFVKLTSFYAFESVVERVGISVTSGKFELVASLGFPIEVPSIELNEWNGLDHQGNAKLCRTAIAG